MKRSLGSHVDDDDEAGGVTAPAPASASATVPSATAPVDAFSLMMESSKAYYNKEAEEECYGTSMHAKRYEGVGHGQTCCANCKAYGRTTLIPDSYLCFFCEKPCCDDPSCSVVCHDCGERFCSCCSTMDYDNAGPIKEVSRCISCYQAYHSKPRT